MLRWRFDSRFAVYSHDVKLAPQPSEYFGRNIVITTSGVCSPAALACALAEMGNDAVMFSVDCPYESTAVAADFIESAPLSDDTPGAGLLTKCGTHPETRLIIPRRYDNAGSLSYRSDRAELEYYEGDRNPGDARW